MRLAPGGNAAHWFVRLAVHSSDSPSRSWRRDLAWLTLAFGLLYLFALGNRPLANPDEGRYAGIPREMLARGDWVTPVLADVPYFEKPPLVYWTVGACRRLFGPGEFSARLTPALFALGGVLLTYAAGRRLRGRETGIAAAVVLGTSVLYFVLGRILLLDMAVSVLMSATLFCFILGVREAPGARRRWLFYGLYASAALATLTKGLIGFLVTGAVMFLWLLVFNQWKRLRPLHLPTGILLFLAIAAPWHVLAAQRNESWAQFYFVHEHWERFTTTAHGRYEPWWFFGPILLMGLFPWTGFLWAGIREGVAGGWGRRKENAEAWFLITWAAFVFLFFSKSQSKLIPYILPVLPPLAVLIGAALVRGIAEGAKLVAGMRVFGAAAGLLGAAVVFVVARPGVIKDAEQLAELRPYGLALAAVLLLGGVAAPWATRVRGAQSGLTILTATAAGFFALVTLAAPAIQKPGTKELARVARERVQAADRVYHFHAFFHDFVYYTERPVGLVDYIDELQVQFLTPAERARRFIAGAELARQWGGSGRVWLVLRRRDRAALDTLFANPRREYRLIAESRDHLLLSNQP